MLKYRALTWTLLIVFVLWGIYSLPLMGFAVIMTGFWGLAAWEWMGLLKIESYFERAWFILFTLLFSIIAYFYFPGPILWLGALGWLGAIYFIFQFPDTLKFSEQRKGFKFGLTLLYLAPCWLGLTLIRADERGLIYILFMFSLIWLMDTLGYLVGKPWGKHKLLPKLSPGKSIEGVLGGIIFTLLLSGMLIYSSKSPFKPNTMTLCLILFIACFSVVGDLFESLLKRQAGVKDSGKLLPGHGGILDRMDSTFSVVPWFALILPWIQ